MDNKISFDKFGSFRKRNNSELCTTSEYFKEEKKINLSEPKKKLTQSGDDNLFSLLLAIKVF